MPDLTVEIIRQIPHFTKLTSLQMPGVCSGCSRGHALGEEGEAEEEAEGKAKGRWRGGKLGGSSIVLTDIIPTRSPLRT